MSANVESRVGAVVGGECTHRCANPALNISAYFTDLVLRRRLSLTLTIKNFKADEVFKLLKQLRAKSFFTTTIHPSI